MPAMTIRNFRGEPAATLVVGGDIRGMRAALDLADASQLDNTADRSRELCVDPPKNKSFLEAMDPTQAEFDEEIGFRGRRVS